MDNLISRQDAISIPVIPKEHRKYFHSLDDAYETGWNEALSCVNMLPSAERKGYWEYLYDRNYKCSNCGSWWKCEDEPCKEGLNFCPNCGADMRGEEE